MPSTYYLRRPVSLPVPAAVAASPPLQGTGQAGLVMVTWASVGGATDYLVSVGTAPGASDIGTFDTGSTALAYDVALPSGVYYVRVAAVVGGVTQSPSSPDVVFNV